MQNTHSPALHSEAEGYSRYRSLHFWHSWASIAIDWYPSRNKLGWDHEKTSLYHSDPDEWWMIWEEEGWLSLGFTESRDWMHVQATKR